MACFGITKNTGSGGHGVEVVCGSMASTEQLYIQMSCSGGNQNKTLRNDAVVGQNDPELDHGLFWSLLKS
jgi:hypothetical protein